MVLQLCVSAHTLDDICQKMSDAQNFYKYLSVSSLHREISEKRPLITDLPFTITFKNIIP